MNELEVVLDVRQAPDSLDLVIVRQKVVAEGSSLRFVGQPSESRINLSLRRASLSLSMKMDHEVGIALVAHLKNVGMAFLDDVKIDLESRFPDPRAMKELPSIPSAHEIGQAYSFIPANRKVTGPILPGETRDYYLPGDFLEIAARRTRELPPDKFRVVARAGQDEIAAIPGNEVAPFLDIPTDIRKLKMERRVRVILDALAETDKRAAGEILSALGEKEPSELRGARLLKNSKNVYAIPISADLCLLVRRVDRTNHIEVMDVVRADILKEMSGSQDAAEAKE